MQVPEATAKRWWAVLFRRNSEQTGKTEAQRLFWRWKISCATKEFTLVQI